MIPLERFYKKNSLRINAVSGYIEDDRIAYIIKSCRLKPYDVLSGIGAGELDRCWADEYRNSMRVHKDKRLKLIFNDLSIDPEYILTTDMYANVNLTDLPKISKLAYFSIIPDEIESNNYVYIVSFLGNDNYFRTRIFIENRWTRISTLYLGLRLLHTITDHLSTNYFIELDPKKVSTMLPLGIGRHWITFWPPHRHAVSVLNREKPFLLEQLEL